MAGAWNVVETAPAGGGTWDVVEHKPARTPEERLSRAVVQPARGFNESLATTLGAIPDLIGAGMRGIGIPNSPEPQQYTNLARRGINAVATAGGMFPDAPVAETGTEKFLYGAGKGVGDAASIMMPATAVAQAGGRRAQIAQMLAAQPSTQVAAGAMGGGVGEATGNPYLGMAASLATPVAMSAAGRLLQPVRPNLTPEMQRLIAIAGQEGIPLTPAQQTGSKPLRYMEGAFDTLPFTAGPAETQRQVQRTAFNRASLLRSGTNADVATPEVINAARARIGGVIREVADRNVMEITPPVRAELNGLAAEMQRLYPNEVARPVVARIEEVLGKEVAGAVPGQLYRRLDSELGKQIRNTSDGIARDGLTRVRDTLRGAMDASITPADQAAWQEARRQYANLMVTAKAASGAGADTAVGNVSPLALRQAIDQSTGQGFRYGRGDQNDLARIGQAFLRPPPDSGTAGRLYWQGLLTGSIPGGAGGGAMMAGADPMTAVLTAAGALAAPRMAQAAYNSPAVRDYLINGVPGTAGIVRQAPQLNRGLAAALLNERLKGELVASRP